MSLSTTRFGGTAGLRIPTNGALALLLPSFVEIIQLPERRRGKSYPLRSRCGEDRVPSLSIGVLSGSFDPSVERKGRQV